MALGTYLLLGTGCTNKDNEDNKDIKNNTDNTNVVKATLNHFSIYILLDKKIYDASWN